MKSILIGTFLWGVLFYCGSCSRGTGIGEARIETEKLFFKELKKSEIHNAFLAVYSPSHPIDWNYSGGKFQNGDVVSAANPFYTASIGKVFTATAIALLVEQGQLRFEDPVGQYLPDSIVKNLHVLSDQEYSSQIRVAQLLQHTSGLPDYFEDQTLDGSPNVMELLFADTQKFWTPEETIFFTKEKMKPLFEPGNGYHYTDTEYVLLGLIIEKVSGKSLHHFFKEAFFTPLDMSQTFMFKRSKPIEKSGKMAEIFVEDFEVSTMNSLTADWAGGGIVSSAGDLIKFQQALFSGKIISPELLKKMQPWVPESHGMEYGFGLRKIYLKKLFPVLPDLTLIGHSGSTASFMFYCPQLDVYLAGTLNQTSEVKQSVVLMTEVLTILKKALSRGDAVN